MTTQTFERPDVYFTETLANPAPASGVSLSNGVFVGPHPRGPVTITQVTSYRQFAALYGDFQPGVAPTDLQIAVWLFFSTGGGVAYVMRVTTGAEVAATASLADKETTPATTLHITANNPGTWGSGLSIGITDAVDPARFNLLVFYNGVQVERWADLTMDPADPNYAVNILNSTRRGSLYVNLTDAGLAAALNLRRPAQTGTGTGSSFVLVPVVLTGGVNAPSAPTTSEYDTALAAVDAVTDPVNLNLPGVTDPSLINQAIAYCSGRGDAFLIIDGTTGMENDPASQLTQVTLYSNSSYASGPYYPRIIVADPSAARPGLTRVVAPGGAVMGFYAVNDASIGVQKTPAGLGARIPNAVGLETILSSDDLATLNNNNVNALRSVPGAGVVIMGGRTLATSGRADKYISVRRTLIYVKAMLRQLTSFALFEDNDYLLQQQVTNIVTQFLLQLWQARGLAGATAASAFYVVCDASNNTETDVEQGILHVQVGVAPQRPAEFIAIQISQISGQGSTAAEAA